MKIAIVGSRTFDDYNLLSDIVGRFAAHYVKVTIVSGGATGADLLAKRFAEDSGFDYLEFLPDWDKLGKKAGFVRNEDIIKSSDVVFAFWDGVSKGTANSLNWAKKMRKPTTIYYF